MPKIAVLQMCSGIDPEANFAAIEAAAKQAQGEGATMLFTPEMSMLLDSDRKRAAGHILPQEASPYLGRLAQLAQDCRVWMTIGIPVQEQSGRYANRQWLFAPDGSLHAQYDKIHMFDVELANGETWRESNAYEAGDELVTASDTPLGRLGLTICYDLRFPALFGALGDAQCDAITVPAAFTRPTGIAHWHVMLRARAIEASAFVIAAAQVGQHEDGRETYGHSLVVDPWGEIILDLGGDGPGLGICEVDLARIGEVRQQLPSLANRRKIAK